MQNPKYSQSIPPRRWRRAWVREDAPESRAPSSAAANRRLPLIVCDDRERASGVVDALCEPGDIRVSVRRLKIGDYLIDGRILVERKTFADFALSIVDGRLFRQATELLQASPERALFVLEGAGELSKQTHMRREALQGAGVALSVILGIPLLRSRDASDTARLLRYAAWQAIRDARGAWSRPGYRPQRLRTRQLFVLQGLPGVGPERATALLDAFGSVASIFAADQATLAAVPGIGLKTAASIHRIVHTRTPPGTAPRDPATGATA